MIIDFPAMKSQSLHELHSVRSPTLRWANKYHTNWVDGWHTKILAAAGAIVIREILDNGVRNVKPKEVVQKVFSELGITVGWFASRVLWTLAMWLTKWLIKKVREFKFSVAFASAKTVSFEDRFVSQISEYDCPFGYKTSSIKPD